MRTRRHFVQSAASLGALAACPFAALAQAFEAVKIINGFPAGGTADSASRRVAERIGGTSFSKHAGVVENKPGAGGRIACEVVKAAPPDGSTNAAINAALKEKSVNDSPNVMGLVAQGSTGAEMDRSQKEEFTRWGPIVKKVGFTPES
jgi:tripartite-type tricarboxylate transporter receptor subunit TctC